MADSGCERSSAVFLTAKAYKNNPMLKMYGAALSSSHENIFSCIDHADQVAPGCRFISSPRFFWGYFLYVLAKISFGAKHHCAQRNRGAQLFAWLLSPVFFFDYIVANLRQLYVAHVRMCNQKVGFVVAVDGDFLLAAFMLAKLKRARFFYSVYEVWPDQIAPSGGWELSAKYARTCIEAFFCRRAFGIITVTRAWSKLVRRRYSLPQSKFIEVPVCPEPVSLPDETVHEPVRFHYHGAFFLSRGLDELLRAFKGVQGAHLYLRGFGPDEQKLKELVVELKLDGQVFFLPPVDVDQLVVQGREYDVGVIIAKPDTANGRMCTGFKCFEYLNSGLALLAPSSLPLRAFIKDTGCGLNYGWPDEMVFREKIQHIIAHKSELLILKRAARNASAKFNAGIQAVSLHAALIGEING